MAAAWGRVSALLLRHSWILFGSWPRLLEMIYWPATQLIIWGFMARYLAGGGGGVAAAAGWLLGAVLLWEVLLRAQLGVCLSFLEEMWSRNLGHLFASPLRPWEMIAELLLMSGLRAAVGVIPAMGLAWALYAYDILSFGPALVAYYLNLMMFGWVVGLVCSAAILRFGLGAENVAWVSIFLFTPISGVYYPVAVLPTWLQPVALAFPAAHVFEAMRAAVAGQGFQWGAFAAAAALNLLYLGLAAGLFLAAFAGARAQGKLLQMGE